MSEPDEPKFTFQCPRQWDDLNETSDPNTRHCDECNEPVTMATTPEEERYLAKEGRCAAIPREDGAHQIGEVDYLDPPAMLGQLDLPPHVGRLGLSPCDLDRQEDTEPEPEKPGFFLRLRGWFGGLFQG